MITAKDEFKVAEADTSKPSFDLGNDSWLDTSDSSNFKIKTKKNGTGNGKVDDDDLMSGKESSYVPVKGQKMAAKRLQKIQGLFFISFRFFCVK